MKPLIRIIVFTTLLYSTTLLPTSHGQLVNANDLIVVGAPVAFDGSLSSDNDSQDKGFTPRWSWDFNYDGSFHEDLSTTNPLTYWVFESGGTFTVAVKYYDNDNEVGAPYQIVVQVNAMNRQYYLKDHLGSIRMTVQGGRMMIQDDFSNDLSQWKTIIGGGFTLNGGELWNSSSGTNIIVNALNQTLDDGILTVETKNVQYATADPSVIVRCQDAYNYYMIHPYNNYVAIYEVIGGMENWRASGSITTIVPGQKYKLQITLEGGSISVCWNGTPVVSWTDVTPWTTGKIGFHQYGNRSVRWDNVSVWTNNPGKIVGYDDYDAWGERLPQRNNNTANPDDKVKFTGKELDTETGLTYFGARYYDSWRGQWTSLDPLAEKYPGLSPYNYAADNPLIFFDPDGRVLKFANGSTKSFQQNFAKAEKYLREHGAAGKIDILKHSKNIYYIQEAGSGSFDPKSKTINWSAYAGYKNKQGTKISPSIVLAHEASHASQFDQDKSKFLKDSKTPSNLFKTSVGEKKAIQDEIDAARKTNEIGRDEVTRDSHREGGGYYPTEGPTSRKEDETNADKVYIQTTLPEVKIEPK